MGEYDGLFFEIPEMRGRQIDGVWHRFRNFNTIRRRVEHSRDRLDVDFEGFVASAATAPGTAYRFEIHFSRGEQPWRIRRHAVGGRVVCELRVYVPLDVHLIADDDALDLALRRWLCVAIDETIPELGANCYFQEPAPIVPLLALSCVPRSGAGDRWHRNRDVDAYAKAARVLCELSAPVLLERRIADSWPVLELVPGHQVSEVSPCEQGRAYLVSCKDASTLDNADLAARVAADFVSALEIRAGEGQSDLRDLRGALSRHWKEEGYQLSFQAAVVRRQGHQEWLRLDYRGSVRGGTMRPVVGRGGRVFLGHWQAMKGGAEAFAQFEPGVEYSWLADGRIQLSSPALRPPLQIYAADLAAIDPLEALPDVRSVADCWRMIDAAHSVPGVESMEDLCRVLVSHVATFQESSMLVFGAWWAELNRALSEPAIWEAANAHIGFVSDDVFEDLRGWIILQGERTYRDVREDPGVVRGLDMEGLDRVESLTGDLREVYEVVVGEPLQD